MHMGRSQKMSSFCGALQSSKNYKYIYSSLSVECNMQSAISDIKENS
jgi:hypothetical protein